MGARENECQISPDYILHIKCLEFYLTYNQFLSNLTFIISDFHEKFFLVLLQMIYYIFELYIYN